MKMIFTSLVAIISSFFTTYSNGQIVSLITTIDEPRGALTPKSIVHNGQGIFAAQNMMYNHSICFYDRSFDLIRQLDDKVRLSDYGFCDLDHWYMGSPVECDFSSDGRFAFVSNYKLYGKGFHSDATDNCNTSQEHDRGYVYKIDVQNFEIVEVYQVGSVPKYVFYLEGHQLLAVSNWCSGSVTLIDLISGEKFREISVGSYPRGIAVYENKLLVAIMGERDVAVIDFKRGIMTSKFTVGSGPRDLHVDNRRGKLYISLNNENALVTYDLQNEKVIEKKYLGKLPRSMALSADGHWLFACLYGDHQVAVLNASEGRLLQKISTCYKPIGIEFDDEKKQLWVACYGGEISVYQLNEQAEEVTALPKKRAPEQRMESSVENATLIVCGSFSDEGNAQSRRKALELRGVESSIMKSNGFYRIVVPVGEEKAREKKEYLETKLGFKLWLLRT